MDYMNQKTDQVSGLKAKIMKNSTLRMTLNKNFVRRATIAGCGLVERLVQTLKRSIGVMLLEEIVKVIKFCFSTIIRDMRYKKEKTIQ